VAILPLMFGFLPEWVNIVGFPDLYLDVVGDKAVPARVTGR